MSGLEEVSVLAEIELPVEIPPGLDEAEARQAVQDAIGHTGAIVVDIIDVRPDS